MKYEPHAYQEYATQRIIDNPASALFLDCGLGIGARQSSPSQPSRG